MTPLSLDEYAEAVDLHPLWQGVLHELPMERSVTPGHAYQGPPPGTWTRAQRSAWLELVERIADMLYTVSDPPLQILPAPPSDEEPKEEPRQPADELAHAELHTEAPADPLADSNGHAPVHEPKPEKRGALLHLSPKTVDNALQRVRRKLSEPLADPASTIHRSERKPDPPAAPPAPEPDGWPCKVDGCTELAPTNRSRFARICLAHRKTLQDGGTVTISGQAHILEPGAGGGRIAPAPPGANPPRGPDRESSVRTAPAPAPVSTPVSAWIHCRWCGTKKPPRHVEEHDTQVKRERDRQEAERAKIAHLSGADA